MSALKEITLYAEVSIHAEKVVTVRGQIFETVEAMRETRHEATVWSHIEPSAGNHLVLAYDKLTEALEALEDALTAMKG